MEQIVLGESVRQTRYDSQNENHPKTNSQKGASKTTTFLSKEGVSANIGEQSIFSEDMSNRQKEWGNKKTNHLETLKRKQATKKE